MVPRCQGARVPGCGTLWHPGPLACPVFQLPHKNSRFPIPTPVADTDPIACDLEPRDTRARQNRSAGVPRGVGDEYADGERPAPAVDQSAHRRAATPHPTPPTVSTRAGGPVLPRGEAGAASGPAVRHDHQPHRSNSQILGLNQPDKHPGTLAPLHFIPSAEQHTDRRCRR